MSLINDALKKAQRQRGGEPEPSPASPASPSASLTGAAAHSHHVRRKPPGFETQMLVIGGGAALVIVALVVALIFVLRDKDAPPQLAKSDPTVTAPEPSRPAAQPPADRPADRPAAPGAPIVAAPKESAIATPPVVVAQQDSAPKFTLDPAPADRVPSTTTPAQPSNERASPGTSNISIASNQAPVANPPAATTPGRAARPSAAMANAIEGYRVAGIRASGSDPRVLMNDRVFRVNDMIDHVLGIRLTDVQSNALTFVDVESGAVYTRHF